MVMLLNSQHKYRMQVIIRVMILIDLYGIQIFHHIDMIG